MNTVKEFWNNIPSSWRLIIVVAAVVGVLVLVT